MANGGVKFWCIMWSFFFNWSAYIAKINPLKTQVHVVNCITVSNYKMYLCFQDKMDEHLHNIDEFHGTLKNFTDWLNNAEITMRGFKYPSKLVHRVVKQMEEHNVSSWKRNYSWTGFQPVCLVSLCSYMSLKSLENVPAKSLWYARPILIRLLMKM